MFCFVLGTGKTKTIVAAITQIVRTSKNHVLVCAHSNAACDEVADRLMDVLEQEEIFRMYAKTHDIQKLSNKMRSISNMHHGEFKYPSLKFLNGVRVQICTLLTAGCLVRSRGRDANFDSGHFSHVFIEEAGFVQEPATLIPIAGAYVNDNPS